MDTGTTTQPTNTRPGTVHLVGGGRDEDAVVALVQRFVAEAADRGGTGGQATVTALLVLEADDDDGVERFSRVLTLAGARVAVRAIVEGEVFPRSALDGADGLFVGGGLTPAYLAAFAEIAPRVRQRVQEGMPYLGFSAGAAIAAERAVIGGYLIDGVAVCDGDAGEELEEVTVVDGLGLVPFAVDVHAAQWGTVSRLVAAVGAGLVDSGVAIDEHTVVRWSGTDEAPTAVEGRGAAWQVARGGDPAQGSVLVTRSPADG